MAQSCVRNVLLVAAVVSGAMLVAPAGADTAAVMNPEWNKAEVVFLAELSSVTEGATRRTDPPTHYSELVLKVVRVFHGTVVDKTVSVGHSYMAVNPFFYQVGKRYMVALGTTNRITGVRRLVAADEAVIGEAEAGCGLLPGWEVVKGAAVSPWAGLGKAGWSGELAAGMEKGKMVCSVTGRPELKAGAELEWSVEAIAPPKAAGAPNPDGDGEYRLTLKNPTKEAVTVAALLMQEGKPLWRESVVVVCQDKAYPCPGAKGVTGKVSPLTLAAGESVSTVIKILALQGPDWPKTGEEIELRICLGEKGKTVSFFYLPRVHDKVREGLGKSGGVGGK